ncbi:UDP-N-acetyl-D-glucosamine 2-epimerase, UDP-hydrolysing [Terasakiispira papahanaumokuakeensis]|uniref:UDP-N-acetyl-D-glucosamine 2-epimerase, UDP-hydrolysing n=1 Tax=Terasakiispira papahanaumokuakeensis TaxID=197479 RepID=A0A1E2VB12_9GAMM|nr:UDP-N-acetylglucosamine 2-epimerase [Terasakiispira papahanaumokuakeensis]ODC04161.1 UDP-N-acetyl-D-glucosamine 2-epimerase, UDP-hydrolysing [Terasakiispira papahanaumokuakeensis]
MKTIAIFTGTRAEYGLLYWLIKEIEKDSTLELKLIVSGMHLSPEFGHTVDEIENDGFLIHEKIEMLLSSSSEIGIAKSIGLGVISFADALNRLKPDCLVILGDRFEALSVAQTAMLLRIPIAHLHGGEITEGAIDESIRHSITKMAQLHFTSTEIYRNRVIQLGENPERVFNVGALAIENIKRLPLISQPELEASLNFSLGDSSILVTYHPVTLDENGGIETLKNLIGAIDALDKEIKIVITSPNADAHGRDFIDLIKEFTSKNKERVFFTSSLGKTRYLSLVKICKAVVGNSSSGIFEAPALKTPSVNIGERQRGRLQPKSVIQSGESKEEIEDAIKQAISKKQQIASDPCCDFYGEGHASQKIIKTLKETNLNQLTTKKFYDLPKP